MKVVVWLGLVFVATVMVAGAALVIPGVVTGSGFSAVSPVSVATSSQPVWNSGNLCGPSGPTTGPALGDVTCVSLVSASTVPLWYNFSGGEVENGVINVVVYGSSDCINMNFHSFYSTIVITLKGSSYSCPSSSGPPDGPGVNVVMNAEGNVVVLYQQGSWYSTSVTMYGTTNYFSTEMDGKGLSTTVTYIGTTAGFTTCPSGITDGRVHWNAVAYGSKDTFSTIFVDGTNVAHPPPNYPYSTEPLLPPDGMGFGMHDLYGNETTQTAPLGSCQYL